MKTTIEINTRKTEVESKSIFVRLFFFWLWNKVDSISFYTSVKDRYPQYTISSYCYFILYSLSP